MLISGIFFVLSRTVCASAETLTQREDSGPHAETPRLQPEGHRRVEVVSHHWWVGNSITE